MNLGLSHLEKLSTPHYVLTFFIKYMESIKPLNAQLDGVFLTQATLLIFLEGQTQDFIQSSTVEGNIETKWW